MLKPIFKVGDKVFIGAEHIFKKKWRKNLLSVNKNWMNFKSVRRQGLCKDLYINVELYVHIYICRYMNICISINFIK